MLRTHGSAGVVISRTGQAHPRVTHVTRGASVLIAACVSPLRSSLAATTAWPATWSPGWSQRASRKALLTVAWAGLTCLTVWTAIAAKEGRLTAPLLADVDVAQIATADRQGSDIAGDDASFDTVGFEIDIPVMGNATDPETAMEMLLQGEDSNLDSVPAAPASPFDAAQAPSGWERFADDASVRWFNGRPIRPVREMWMTVTAYSPDHRSCGDSADGITATLHHVSTNGHALVAADPEVLAYGSMITVPGYDLGRVVPVLDCGGAIKGRRLDVLFPTHEQAVRWGVRRVKVVVWGFADGKPAENPRKVR